MERGKPIRKHFSNSRRRMRTYQRDGRSSSPASFLFLVCNDQRHIGRSPRTYIGEALPRQLVSADIGTSKIVIEHWTPLTASEGNMYDTRLVAWNIFQGQLTLKMTNATRIQAPRPGISRQKWRGLQGAGVAV